MGGPNAPYLSHDREGSTDESLTGDYRGEDCHDEHGPKEVGGNALPKHIICMCWVGQQEGPLTQVGDN